MGAVVAALSAPGPAGSAARQDYPAFVLVAGLLLIGLAAQEDGLFKAAGDWLAGRSGGDLSLVLLSSALVGVVTAALNLDTSVAFLTPVLVQAGRRRPAVAPALTYGGILLANAGSLLLPGSNLTNLIVFGSRPVAGSHFLAHMALPWVASLAITSTGLVWWSRRADPATSPSGGGPLPTPPGTGEAAGRPTLGIGLIGILAAIVLVLILPSPAVPVAVVAVSITGLRLLAGRHRVRDVAEALDGTVLIGLLGVAVGLGALARVWPGPADLLSHLDRWGTAAMAAGLSVLINNLPAASLLSARPPAHPYALLLGLNLGPNLFFTGSLSWVIWLRAARQAGANPSPRSIAGVGIVVATLSTAAGVGLLSVVG
jgi:arsenical pump membrane protein